MVTIALALEVRTGADLVRRAYLTASYDPGLAAAVDQGWSDETVAATAVEVHPTCPVAGFWLGFVGPPPTRLEVRAGDRVWSVQATPASTDQPLYGTPSIDTAWYRQPEPVSAPFTIELPAGAAVQASATDRTPALALSGAAGDPVGRLYCHQPDAEATTFRQAYDPNHPDVVDLDRLRALAIIEMALAAGVTVLATVAAGRERAGGTEPVGPEPVERPGWFP